ncbi:biotin--[acetyl-CoA-carboxylase] ligase [Brachybacterium huguangmaarense]
MRDHAATDVPVVWAVSCGSTQDVARALLAASPAASSAGSRAASGHEPPFAVATDDQRGGRGRLGRPWAGAPGRSLALTLAHRPAAGPDRRSWYPLVAGLAVLDAVRAIVGPGIAVGNDGGDDADAADIAGRSAVMRGIGLKWPNDVLAADGRKLAGILAEAGPDGTLLLGVGLNLRGPVRDADGAEVPGAVALDALARRPEAGDAGAADGSDGVAAPADAAAVLASALLRELAALDAADGDALVSGQAARYRETCVTIDRSVRVTGIAGRPGVVGRALGIDPAGRLLVGTTQGTRTVDVGDVQHVRTEEDAEK